MKFYEQLYAYKAPKAQIPAGGRGIFDNFLPKGHPSIDGPMPELPTDPIRAPEAAPKLPDDPFAAPKVEPGPKPDAPKED